MQPKLAWDDFRFVKAIADQGGLGGAAAMLGLNHSTVFRRLTQLEAELGTSLFERHRGGYVATPAGEEMVALAGRMQEDVTALSLRFAGREIAPSGDVRVTTTDTLFLELLLPVFAAFRVAHPAIRLDLVLGGQALNLSRRDADIAIRASDSPGETLVGRQLATIHWAIYGRETDIAALTEGGADLFARNWVSLGDELGHVKTARYVRAHVPPERIALKCSTVLGLAEAVELGIGIGPLPCFIADRRPALRRLAPPDPGFSAALWILTHPDIRHAPRIRTLMDFAGTELAKRRDLIEGQRPATAAGSQPATRGPEP